MLKYPSQPTYNDLGEWGAWGEICKPFATARVAPNAAAAEKYRYYFGTTCHWRLWRRLYPEQLARRYADHNLLRY